MLTIVAGTPDPVVTAPDIVLPSGLTFQVPIDGHSPIGSPLTFAVVSVSDSNVTAELTTGNRSLRLLVTGKDPATNNFRGELIFQLFEDLAPATTGRIIDLVESNFYTGLTFHRIIDDFVAQGGDPDGNGSGGSGVTFDDEYDLRLAFTGFGQLAMANSGDDRNDSQFFVTDADLTLAAGGPPPPLYLSYNHSIFGQQTSGFDVLEKLIHTPLLFGDLPLVAPVISNAVVFTDNQDAVLRVSAPTNFTGSATVTVRATDTNDVSTEVGFTVTVVTNTVNLRPFLDPLPASLVTTQSVSVTLPLSITDFEDDPLNLLVGTPGNPAAFPPNLSAQYDPATESLIFTPDPQFAGDIPILVGARDQTDHD
ncbi:peptidylprolyl isomerase, partial [bacterium]|nr:peptidylprolyl isomerase [bacterium]